MTDDKVERVYAAVRRVPKGKVATYGQIARVAGLPPGSALSSGAAAGESAWEVADGLHSLSLIPPANFAGQLDLEVTASSVDGDATAATDATMRVGVVPVADAPDIAAGDVSGPAGQPLPLAIAVNPADPREAITLTLSGLPDDIALSAGQSNGNGEWLLQPADLEGLAVLAPQDQVGTFDAQVTGIATDGSDRAVVETSFAIAVTAPEEQPASQSVGLVPPANAAVQTPGSEASASAVEKPEAERSVTPPEVSAARSEPEEAKKAYSKEPIMK